MPKKLNIETVREFVVNNSNCSLISNEYINSKKKLQFRCECGNEFETSFDTFKNANQRQCPDCGIELRVKGRKIGLNEAKEVFHSKGLEIISDKYVNARTKIIAKDSEGYIVYISLDNLSKGEKASRFSIYNPKTIANIKLWIKNNNCDFKLLSNEFKSAKSKIKFQCNKGHIFETSWNKIYSQNAGCPICHSSKGEDFIKRYLDSNNIKYEMQKSFEGCKYKKMLRFDFYIKNKNTCIEFQGYQHYEPVKIFGGDNRFKAQQVKDNIKVEFCKNNNIKLIRIPYFEINNIDNILKSAL